MLGIWADYSGGRPSGLALRNAGIMGVIRYIGLGSSGKRLTAAEYRDLTANGIQVLTVAESTTTEANNGYNAGVADAQVAVADRAALGLPANTVIFAANDQPSFNSADVDYVRGFRDVLGVGRTGVYGFGDFLVATHNAGLSSVYWQAGHPPNTTGSSSFVHFWQRQGTLGNGTSGPASPTILSIGGVPCDLNNQLIQLPGQVQVTSLDDTFQSEYVNPQGQRSTVTLSYASTIRQLDARSWYYNQVLNGEYKFPMPDGAKRNIADALADVTNRLMSLDAQMKTVASAIGAEETALLSALGALPAGQPVAVSPTEVAAALATAGLPDAVAASLAHLLAARLAG